MIERSDDVVQHTVTVEGGQPANVLVTTDGQVAFVYGDVTLSEATLVIRARCAFNADVLGVSTCECAERSQHALTVARRAPLGVFVYLNESTVASFAAVLQLLDCLPAVERLYLPFPSPGDVALLRDTTNYQLVHSPVLRPPGDDAWPRPRANLTLRARLTQALRELFPL